MANENGILKLFKDREFVFLSKTVANHSCTCIHCRENTKCKQYGKTLETRFELAGLTNVYRAPVIQLLIVLACHQLHPTFDRLGGLPVSSKLLQSFPYSI